MSIILDTQPYMLYETVGMLVKYVNGISMLEVRDTMLRLYRKGLDDTWRRRLECLQKIIQTVCPGCRPWRIRKFSTFSPNGSQAVPKMPRLLLGR